MENALFRKGTSGNVDLIASFRLSSFRTTSLSFLVKNEQGLKFSEPFLVENDKQFLAKLRLLNPEELKEKAHLTFVLGYSDAASEFSKDVQFETGNFEKKISFFAFSISAFFKAFFLGLKFFFLTPIFAMFLLMLYQSAAAPRKTFEKSISFYDGMKKIFLIAFVTVWGVLCIRGVFPVF